MWFKAWPLVLLTAGLLAADIPLAATEQPSAANPLDRSVELSKMDAGEQLVQAHCAACHSLALVSQNRMSRQGWIRTIRWMQEKQGLWDLGAAEKPIVDYLERNYGVTNMPWRRKPLGNPGAGDTGSE